MKRIRIEPVRGAFRTTVRVPGSKSITNRALVLGALAAGRSRLTGVLLADDTRVMLGALKALGYAVEVDEAAGEVAIEGRGRAIPAASAELFCGNSGTTIRFLTAMLAAGDTGGRYALDGVARMRERPLAQLVETLRALGAKLSYAGREGYPPVVVGGRGAAGLAGGECVFDAAQSSQYISAVLLAAPYARTKVTVRLPGAVTSEPYVDMTVRMMRQWGEEGMVNGKWQMANGNSPRERVLRVSPGTYAAQDYAIEPDASNASYFWAAAAVCPGASVTVDGLGPGSLQGDVAVADVLHAMGAGLILGPDFVTVQGTGTLHGVERDMNALPDMVQTIAVVALFADSPTLLKNVGNLRIKETDRLTALETELRKLGAKVETGPDWIRLDPPGERGARGAAIATYDDHRMAMAFAVAGLRVPGIEILGPECVTKTYPGFFADFGQLATNEHQ